MMHDNDGLIEHLELLVRVYKHKLRIYALMQLLPWLVIIIFTGYFFSAPMLIIISFSIAIVAIQYFKCIKSSLYQRVNVENFALHLNRQYPELEESSQLIFSSETELSLLRKLQKKRVSSTLKKIVNNDENILLPTQSVKKYLILSATLCSLLFGLYFITGKGTTVLPLSSDNTPKSRLQLSQHIVIESSDITIIPPVYSNLPTELEQNLNLKVLAGSKVRWHLNFADKNLDYFLIFSNNSRVPFIQQDDRSYVFEAEIKFSQIYRIVSEAQALDNIFTLTVNQDKKPNIRILTPRRAVTTLAVNHQQDIATRVKITDDFAISKVEILASIAKGSGESVKFRDQIFSFDRIETLNAESIYHKDWQLTSLGMQPGDELYFTVKAWDNRQPNPQMSQSTTKIIRWLEEEGEGILSDGILIDFISAYFKSQRQIIIDTIELIEDQNELSETKFNETSELLGIAQSHLKEKYGQYLGDEVDDGSASHVISSEAAKGIEESSNDSNHDEEHGHDESEEHSNDEFEMSDFGVDKSGLKEQITRFGHNHEAGDIGIIAKQDPKALMKRSIASMWQAELHLMLSEPAKALPYEQEALKYLNLAKRADRIYVKRLGFEPPPVSEKRRYQGELTDINDYTQHHELTKADLSQQSLSRVFKMLNEYSNNSTYEKNKILDLQEQTDIKKVKLQFEQQLGNRPALIKYVAVLERLLLANSLNLTGCTRCIKDLAYKVWQLIPQKMARPSVNKKSYTNNEDLVREYGQYLREQEIKIIEQGVAQ
ncbi:MAG: hypothetical protein MJK12_18855 [Colwellia sp.]|nr:hypothetical protein [Colwellia sp.]